MNFTISDCMIKLMALLHMSNSESVVRTSECTRTVCLPMYTLIRFGRDGVAYSHGKFIKEGE